MKTQSLLTRVAYALRVHRVASFFALFSVTTTFAGTKNASGFVAHEWGTFTSVQGADGVLLPWRPLQTAELPKFVYAWSHPGYNRAAAGQLLYGKGMMVTLQRMETPVIYFYSDEEITADVTVRFPQGTITEWYPQARRIGPAIQQAPPFVSRLDAGAHKVGANPGFSFASWLPQHAAKDSRIVWSGVKVLPAKRHPELAAAVPMDKSGSHYFAARETDADFVSVDYGSQTNSPVEYERFLFYRGAGSFATPLGVTVNTTNNLVLTNSGSDPLRHLFVLRVRDGLAQFTWLEKLDAGDRITVPFVPVDRAQAVIASELAGKMISALTGTGLYPREAKAMVDTWRDSWFAEDGLRVLYLLPGAWTRGTLPLEIRPQPREVIRVMVGRAEVITPEVETRLQTELTKAQSGDKQARSRALADLRKLGRFAEPAMRRIVSQTADEKVSQLGWQLLQIAFNPPARSAL